MYVPTAPRVAGTPPQVWKHDPLPPCLGADGRMVGWSAYAAGCQRVGPSRRGFAGLDGWSRGLWGFPVELLQWWCNHGTHPCRPPPSRKNQHLAGKPHPPLGFLDLVILGYPHSFAPAVYGAAAPRRVSLRSVHPDRSFKRWPSAPASPVPRRGAGCTHNPPGLFDYHLPVARRWRSAKLPNPAFARRCRAPWGYSHQPMPRPIPANWLIDARVTYVLGTGRSPCGPTGGITSPVVMPPV